MNLQFKTVPTLGAWSQLSDRDLAMLRVYRNDVWEGYHTVNMRGSMGFTAHVLFMLRRAKERKVAAD